MIQIVGVAAVAVCAACVYSSVRMLVTAMREERLWMQQMHREIEEFRQWLDARRD